MYIENAVKGFLTHLKATLSGFNYLEKELFSPSTEYDERLASYVAKVDRSSQLEKNFWLGLVWVFTPMELSSHVARPIMYCTKDTEHLTGKKYLVTNKEFGVSVGVFSPDIYYLIKYAEQFSVLFDRVAVFDVVFPEPLKAEGTYEIQALGLEVSELSLVGREEKGSLSKFEFSFKVIIPIPVLVETGTLIGQDNEGNVKVLLNEGITQEFLDSYPDFVVI